MIDIPFNNKPIEAWGRKNLSSVKGIADAMGIRHRPHSPSPAPMQSRLKVTFRRRDGIIYKIGYSIPKSGIYVHKGVGRGHPITNPREAKKFFDNATDANFPELQDIVADQMGDYVINNIKIN